MKLYAPQYYLDFVCIADKCKHTCCEGWEIDVDDETANRYSAMTEGYGKCVANSLNMDTDPPQIRLTEDERCPHLDENGLCRIIQTLGEDQLCEICKEHPRFYNETMGRREVGVGMSCEAACKLILSSDLYRRIVEIGTFETGFDVEEDEDFNSQFDPLAHRERIYEILSNRSMPYKDRIRAIEKEYPRCPSLVSDEKWKQYLLDMEYLDEANRERFANAYSSDADVPLAFEKQLERILAYFIFRHCACAPDVVVFEASVGACLFFERLIRSVVIYENITSEEDLAELARTVSAELEYSDINQATVEMEFLSIDL